MQLYVFAVSASCPLTVLGGRHLYSEQTALFTQDFVAGFGFYVESRGIFILIILLLLFFDCFCFSCCDTGSIPVDKQFTIRQNKTLIMVYITHLSASD
jgi:ABC-type uncharacterized transport system permease subunit